MFVSPAHYALRSGKLRKWETKCHRFTAWRKGEKEPQNWIFKKNVILYIMLSVNNTARWSRFVSVTTYVTAAINSYSVSGQKVEMTSSSLNLKPTA